MGAVGLTAGQSETSSSGITIVGDGAATVTLAVPLDKLPSIKVGQAATVTPPGLGALTGTVTQISMLPSSSTSTGGTSGSTVTYDVTVTLPSTPQTLASGTYATTTITTASSSDVLTVPVSAVPGVTSGSARVGVLTNGAVTEKTVTVGAVGGGLAEIRTGLTEGEQVVIADVQAALPTNNSQNVRGVTGPTGVGGGTVRFTGAGGGGGRPYRAVPDRVLARAAEGFLVCGAQPLSVTTEDPPHPGVVDLPPEPIPRGRRRARQPAQAGRSEPARHGIR